MRERVDPGVSGDLRRGIRGMPLVCLGLSCAAAAVLAGWFLFASPHGAPSRAHLLLRSALFAREAPRLAARAPVYLSPPPITADRALTGPWRVGIQSGHWHIADLPPELARLRGNTGASYGTLEEADINHRIAERVAADLSRAGVVVDLLPATVPPGYDADAFLAIHADGGGRGERGYKVSAPWRASEASRMLRDAVSRDYGDLTGIPLDRYGVTYNMRGYYAFSWYRFEHAVRPSTPAAIIETGYLTAAADRRVISDDPGTAARAIAAGVITFLGERAALKPGSLVARAYPPMVVSSHAAPLRFFPEDEGRVGAVLTPGTIVRPMDEENGWIELVVWGNFRVFGWMRESDLQTALGG